MPRALVQPPPEAVTTIVADETEWPDTLNAIGSVEAVQGVVVSADLAGTIDRIAFDSGKSVRQGEVLVQLDTRQERAQLAAAEAQRDLARTNFDRMQGLLKDSVISRAEFDNATADSKQTEARVGEIRAAIDRKTIRAPFSGILGIRQVNLGQYLSSGDPIVQLQSLNPIYVNFGVPQQAIGQYVSAARSNHKRRSECGGWCPCRGSVSGPHHRYRSIVTKRHGTSRCRPRFESRRQVAAGHVRAGGGRSRRRSLDCGAAGDSNQHAPSATPLHRRRREGPKGDTYKGVRQQFVKLEGAPAIRSVSVGVNPGARWSPPGLQAA